jgi:hypothetical protein
MKTERLAAFDGKKAVFKIATTTFDKLEIIAEEFGG